MGRVPGVVGRITGEHERGLVREPAVHFLVGFSPQEQPLPLRVSPKVIPVPGKAPGDSSAGGPDDPVFRESGDHGNDHESVAGEEG